MDLPIEFRNATEREIQTLAVFLKRVSFEYVLPLAHSEDEAYTMINGIQRLQTALDNAGYEPGMDFVPSTNGTGE